MEREPQLLSDKDDFLRNYDRLTASQKESVAKHVMGLLAKKSRFDWKRLAATWPAIWDVVAQEMHGFDFEDLVAVVLAKHGYEYAANLRKTRDEGVDLFRRDRDGKAYIIECKLRGRRDVGPREVRSLTGACDQHGVRRGKIVTNRDFTDRAKKTCDDLRAKNKVDIELIDYRALDRMLRSEECAPLRRFFARPNLKGLQDLLRDSHRTEVYVQKRLEAFGSDSRSRHEDKPHEKRG